MKKCSILFLCCLLSCITFSQASLSEKSRNAAHACKETVGATKENINNLLQRKPAVSKTDKCLLACILKALNVIDANGKFSKEFAINLLKEHYKDDHVKFNAGSSVVDKCNDIAVSDDHCEAAAEYQNCIRQRGAEMNYKTAM